MAVASQRGRDIQSVGTLVGKNERLLIRYSVVSQYDVAWGNPHETHGWRAAQRCEHVHIFCPEGINTRPALPRVVRSLRPKVCLVELPTNSHTHPLTLPGTRLPLSIHPPPNLTKPQPATERNVRTRIVNFPVNLHMLRSDPNRYRFRVGDYYRGCGVRFRGALHTTHEADQFACFSTFTVGITPAR